MAFNYESVDWDVHAIFNFDLISNNNVILVDGLLSLISKNCHKFGIFLDKQLLYELTLFLIVRPSRYQ